MYQGRRDEARAFNEWVPETTKQLDAIILSHGHLDHCGKLPVLTKTGLQIPIYCTEATADVSRVVLMDSAEIQMEDADHLNRRDRRPDEPEFKPLYTTTDVSRLMHLIKPMTYGKPVEIAGAKVTLLDAGHILGSSYVIIEWTENGKHQSLLFTADIGRFNTPIINDPTPIPGAFDYVITESTYGGRLHGPIAEIEPQLLDAVQTIIQRKGRLVIPSFALGRTQTILWYMHKFMKEGKIPPINVYVDSPMGVESTEVHVKWRNYYDAETSQLIGKEDLFEDKRIILASSVQQSKQINVDKGPCVIIASSPTCEFGRILHHLERTIENRNDMIIFVGWTPYHTLGRRLQDGQKRVKIYNRFYDVHAEIRTIHGLSAHADGGELVKFLTPTLNANTSAFVVHGEIDQAELFAQSLIQNGMGQAVVPALETEVFG